MEAQMRQLRAALVACGALVLLLTATGAAAAADQGTILFVQGRPGVSVDICVGGTEVASKLAYGEHRLRRLDAGTVRLRFTEAAPGACTGRLLASRRREVTADTIRTVVLTRSAPRLLVFPATPRGDSGPNLGTFVLRHASDIGKAEFRYTSDESIPWYPYPSAEARFSKGDWGMGTVVAGVLMYWWADRPPSRAAIVAPVEIVIQPSTRIELLLLGTTLGNLKLIRVDTPT
jgi:hypothetical protein